MFAAFIIKYSSLTLLNGLCFMDFDIFCTFQVFQTLVRSRQDGCFSFDFFSFFIYRVQFEKPLAANQLIQKKMADISTEVDFFNNFSFV